MTAFFPYRLKELDVLRWAAAASDDATARNLLACELYDKGHWAQAAALWEEACRLAPQEPQYKRNLAVALLSHLHQPQRALRLLKEALALDSEHQQYIIEYLYAAAKANAPVEERLQVIAQYPVQGRQRDDYVLEVAKVYCLAGDYAQAKALMQAHRFMPAEGGETVVDTDDGTADDADSKLDSTGDGESTEIPLNGVSYTVAADELTDEVLDRVVAECGDVTLTNRDLPIYYWQQYISFANTYGMYLSYIMDTSLPLDQQMYDEANTWQQMFLDAGVSMFQYHAAAAQEAEPLNLTGSKVLAAEDNELNAEILQMMLRQAGADVTLVENGELLVKAFEAAAPNTYDYIFTDIMMPVMDGYEACRRIRALDRPDTQSIPIIAMTANAFAEDVQRSLDAGMDAHISKPFDLKKLQQCLAKLSQKRV